MARPVAIDAELGAGHVVLIDSGRSGGISRSTFRVVSTQRYGR
jgi:hypothetical protein